MTEADVSALLGAMLNVAPLFGAVFLFVIIERYFG